MVKRGIPLLVMLLAAMGPAVPAPAAMPAAESAVAAEIPAGDIDPTGRLHGVIRDAKTGNPIAGACLDAMAAVFYTQALATACTGADGAYEMRVPSVMLRINMRAEGYRSLWLPGNPSSTNIIVEKGAAKQVDGTLGGDVGTLQGRITRQDGSPDPFVVVQLYRPNGSLYRNFAGDADGRYSRDDIAAGDYLVMFYVMGYPSQWYPSTTDKTKATLVHIDPSLPVTIDQRALPVSPVPTQIRSIAHATGQVTSGGLPVPDATVKFGASTVTTGSDGRYAIRNLQSASYFISATAAGLPEAWVGGWITPGGSRALATGDNVLDLSIPARHGVVRGEVKDYDNTSLPFTTMLNLVPEGSLASVGTLRARFDGTFSFQGVPEGNYQLKVSARSQTTVHNITVVHGQTTELTSTLPPPAYFEVTILDDVSGAPVMGTCVNASSIQTGYRLGTACTNTDGIALIGPVFPLDAQKVNVATEPVPTHYSASGELDALRNQINRITLRAKPGAALRMSVSRSDGQAFTGNLCAYLKQVPLENAEPNRVCAARDANGVVTFGPLDPGSVRLLLMPEAPLGAQWLGVNGATGVAEQARVFNLELGKITTTPPAVFDLRHSLTARFTNVTSHPGGACARIVPNAYFLAGCTDGSEPTGIDGLGPYKWQVHFDASSYAHAWYGGAASSLQSTLVSLPMQQSELAVTLQRGGWLFLGGTGWDWQPGTTVLTAFDAYTGNAVATSTALHFANLNNDRLMIRVQNAGNTCWLKHYQGPFRRGMPYFGSAAGSDKASYTALKCVPEQPDLLPLPAAPPRKLPLVKERTTVVTGKLRGHSN